MAKTGLLGGSGSGGTPPFIANSPVLSDPSSVFRRGQGGILPERGSQRQMDMVTALISRGMGQAQNSGSPLLAFLAPMLGGAVGARTNGLYKDAQAGRDESAKDTLLNAMMAGRSSPQMRIKGIGAPGTASDPNNAMRNAAMAGNGGPTNAAADAMVTAQTGFGGGKDAFIEAMMPHAIRASESTGIDPRIIIAQAAQETGWGKHAPNNNYFGIKSHGKPGGGNFKTTEHINGKNTTVTDSFRGYSSMGDSADGYADFMLNNPRYRPMMGANGLDAQLSELGRSGYATDPNYAASVGSIARSINIPSGTPAQQVAGRVASGDFTAMSGLGQSPQMGRDQMDSLITLMNNPDVSPEMRDLASTMLGTAMKPQDSMSPGAQIDLAGAMLGLDSQLQAPPKAVEKWRAATKEEAAIYGAESGQFDANGRFYPTSKAANTANADTGAQKNANEATKIVQNAIDELMLGGMSEEDALTSIARNPIYHGQLRMMGIDPTDIARKAAIANAPNPNAGGTMTSAPMPPKMPDNDPLGLR